MLYPVGGYRHGGQNRSYFAVRVVVDRHLVGAHRYTPAFEVPRHQLFFSAGKHCGQMLAPARTMLSHKETRHNSTFSPPRMHPFFRGAGPDQVRRAGWGEAQADRSELTNPAHCFT